MDRFMAEAQLYASRVHEVFPEAEVWLYGSVAKGTAKPHSDIDIAVVFPAGTSKTHAYMPLQAAVNDIADEIDYMIEPAVFEYGDCMGFVERSVLPFGIRLA